jgi:3-hydroxyacyl-[acyl-carrier-protein] dehydratase
MNKEELKQLLPHREPMLLIDTAEAIDETKAVGTLKITGDEWFVQGHFPGNPVVPGVILCEIMAQTCCVLLGQQKQGATPYFTGLNKVKFKNPVKPGDVVQTECEIMKSKSSFYFAEGKVTVDGKLCASGEFSFALI